MLVSYGDHVVFDRGKFIESLSWTFHQTNPILSAAISIQYKKNSREKEDSCLQLHVAFDVQFSEVDCQNSLVSPVCGISLQSMGCFRVDKPRTFTVQSTQCIDDNGWVVMHWKFGNGQPYFEQLPPWGKFDFSPGDFMVLCNAKWWQYKRISRQQGLEYLQILAGSLLRNSDYNRGILSHCAGEGALPDANQYSQSDVLVLLTISWPPPTGMRNELLQIDRTEHLIFMFLDMMKNSSVKDNSNPLPNTAYRSVLLIKQQEQLLHVTVTASAWLQLSRKAVQDILGGVDPFGMLQFTINQRILFCTSGYGVEMQCIPLQCYQQPSPVIYLSKLQDLRPRVNAGMKQGIQQDEQETLFDRWTFHQQDHIKFLLPNGVGTLLLHVTSSSWLHMFALWVLEVTQKTFRALLLDPNQCYFSQFRTPVQKFLRWQCSKLVLNQQLHRTVVEIFLWLIVVHVISGYGIILSQNSSLFDRGVYMGLRTVWTTEVDACLVATVFGHGTSVPPVVEDATELGVSQDMGLDIASKEIILVNQVRSSSRPWLLPGILLPDNSHLAHSSYALVKHAVLLQGARCSRTRLIWDPPSTKHGEWYAPPFVLSTVPVLHFQASTSQNSRTVKVTYKRMAGCIILELQFYHMMIEDP